MKWIQLIRINHSKFRRLCNFYMFSKTKKCYFSIWRSSLLVVLLSFRNCAKKTNVYIQHIYNFNILYILFLCLYIYVVCICLHFLIYKLNIKRTTVYISLWGNHRLINILSWLINTIGQSRVSLNALQF